MSQRTKRHDGWWAVMLVTGSLLGGSESRGERGDLLRLPTVAPVQEISQRDIVLFAAGAVQLRPPQGWWVREVPRGRELRLVVTPGPPPLPTSMPQDGLWLTCHVLPMSTFQDDLQAWLAPRLRLAAGNSAVTSEPHLHHFGPWPAIQQDFLIRGDGRPGRRGFHLLVRTSWGIFEWHAEAPEEVFEARSRDFESVLRDLTLHPPELRRAERVDAARDAEPILGSWKAYRSRLRIRGSGEIEILSDQVRIFSPHNPDDEPPPASRLEGRFRAEGDLLFIEWQDGSRLNFRWKLRQGDLLLTDHEGQISQLRRLFE